MKIMGRLQFRTSYGQNVLRHSIEVAKLSGIVPVSWVKILLWHDDAGFLHEISVND